MADQQAGLYMIAYDIANPKRLVRIHRYLKKQGLPLQYSVFTLVIKRKALLRLLQGLDKLMNKREDDIRCYRLFSQTSAETLGRQMFPKDVMLFSHGMSQLLY
ncbi:CRISPR-associated endoribonuclease Cas2 [Crenothrix polyspora]|jgi:CRISPR-associated protein Cas2|uniref:CRISPR-associated endoribonuclease Cas2 n=1 Tax=Crenothrix polyspora TaxID=360316 RepID=A0A1R4HHT7_9GAMM|nr:CRISPR-associated endonuclease Cas2 [Crenothrix polyspora]SJM95769.1 CRISPR-associated endoribonuclease Cas2 [Crenothrix polyspora]